MAEATQSEEKMTNKEMTEVTAKQPKQLSKTRPTRYTTSLFKRWWLKRKMNANLDYLIFAQEFEQAVVAQKLNVALQRQAFLKSELQEGRTEANLKPNGNEKNELLDKLARTENMLTNLETNELMGLKRDTQQLHFAVLDNVHRKNALADYR